MGRVNEDELEWSELERGGTRFRSKRLAAATDGTDLGCTLYELPPGGRSWPYHWHAGNEEAVYVLAGGGTIRLGGDSERLEAGDYVALPTGEESAHRVINDGDDPLRYLAVSTMREPDVIGYPDSGKVGVYAGAPPGRDAPRSVDAYFRESDAVSYWSGEEDGRDGREEHDRGSDDDERTGEGNGEGEGEDR